MNPPHLCGDTLERPVRTIANVLLDLKEARGEWETALNNAECADRENNRKLGEQFAERMSDADDRIDELRAEFRAMFAKATGLSWSQIEAAIEGGLL